MLGKPSNEDVVAFARGAFGIDDAEMLQFLGSIAGHRGALRSVDRTVRLAAGAALGAGQPLTVDFLKLAWQELNLESVA